MRYNNYHKHTHYSNVSTPDSIAKVEDYAKRAIELGHTSLVTTEHGFAGNIFEYYDVAKKYGLKFVFGIEYYYVNDRFEKDRTNSHLMILAKNKNGMKQMLSIMSEANKTGYYYKPRIDKELLFSLNPEDVVVTSTCVISYINKYDDYEDNFIKPLMNYFGDNFYLEIHDNAHPMQVKYNEIILELHNKYKIPFIHATDSHYIHEEDDKYRTIFLNGKGIFYPEEEGFILDYPDSDKIFERYEKQGVFNKQQVEDSLKNTWIIDNFEDIEMDKEIKMPTLYPNLTHDEKVSKLKSIITEEWKKDMVHISKENYKDYLEGIRFETSIIADTSMEDYFLLNYEIIKRAKELGGVLTMTGRGSAPSFYINKLLGFTEIDRLDTPIELYPTRFMSKSRILESKSLPDIDYNTADPKPFIQASREILGQDNVYYMTAYGTMQSSSAFRNLCRSYGYNMDEYNEVAKDLDRYKNHEKWKDVIEESQRFIGVIDSVAPHPCATILLDKSVSEELGVIKVGDELCVLIDSTTSDYWKYLKNDYLSVTVWDIIAETFKVINQPIPNIRELNELIKNDNKVWDLYDKGLTATLNQVGTNSGTSQVVQYKPKSVRELSGFVAAIRPSFESMKHLFLNREAFSYGIPEFDKILETSDNFVLYQENIMATLVYCGFEEDETYSLLKAIAKKKEGIIEPIYERFINGFTDKTGSRENAEKVWRIIEDAVSYGFNSSHSLSVAYDSIYGAYLKANYPLEYYSVVLNIYENDTSKTEQIHRELEHFNITVINPEFGKAQSKYATHKESNQIIKGMKSIKYINDSVADELFRLSINNTRTDFVGLLQEIAENTSVNTRQLNILIRLNFFHMYGNSKLLELISIKFNDRYKKSHKDKTKDVRLGEIREYALEVNKINDFEVNEKVLFEKQMLGYVQSIDSSYDKSFVVVTDINTKYAPLVQLYAVNNGKELPFKISKDNFFGEGKVPNLQVGDLIKIIKIEQKPKQQLINGRWIKTDIMQYWLTNWELINRIEKSET
ncbi:DNA polymerase III alpha subunit [Psychrobacillus phage Perkons]|nr:DNA polymerase III alpha subunit [Psychrobacillus phage Perkons]